MHVIAIKANSTAFKNMDGSRQVKVATKTSKPPKWFLRSKFTIPEIGLKIENLSIFLNVLASDNVHSFTSVIL